MHHHHHAFVILNLWLTRPMSKSTYRCEKRRRRGVLSICSTVNFFRHSTCQATARHCTQPSQTSTAFTRTHTHSSLATFKTRTTVYTLSSLTRTTVGANNNTTTRAAEPPAGKLNTNRRTHATSRSGLGRLRRRHIQEVPDDDGVVVRTADDLEVVELQPEHAASVLLHSQHHARSAFALTGLFFNVHHGLGRNCRLPVHLHHGP